jgi:signal transduction histidine kinase
LAYVLTTVPIAAPVAGTLSMLALPWLVAGRDLVDGNLPEGPVIFFMVVGAALVAGFGPLVAIPLAALERRRLVLVDARPIRSGHALGPRDPIPWLRMRYTEAATWREVLYGCFLALVVPAGYFAAAVLALLDGVLVLSPVIAATGTGSWQLGTIEIRTVGQTIPLVVLGLVLLPGILYLLGLIAGGHAAVARGLLGAGEADNAALREVAQSRNRLVDAFETERRRIERDLHDGAQHRLTSLTLQLGMARLDLPADSPAADPLTQAHTQAKELMVVLRDLIHGIRPQALTDLGLPAALRELAVGSPVPVTITGLEGAARPPEKIEATAYFVASEALTNVVKHAQATQADVRLSRLGESLVMEISDDGRGGADPAFGTGLTGLADRVAAVGGRLLLASPPGGGTRIRVELPCGQ